MWLLEATEKAKELTSSIDAGYTAPFAQTL